MSDRVVQVGNDATTFAEIRKMPRTLERAFIEAHPSTGYHDSLLRSYHILQKVKYILVEEGVSASLLMDIIEDLEAAE